MNTFLAFTANEIRISRPNGDMGRKKGKMKRRYVYLKGLEIRSFSNYQKMKEFAKDEKNNGKYYISCPNITFVHTRENI